MDFKNVEGDFVLEFMGEVLWVFGNLTNVKAETQKRMQV